MGIYPQRVGAVYTFPPRDECVCEDHPVALGPDDELRCIWYTADETYKVDFTIVQMARVDGVWVQIARIDCKHSEVHMHQLHRDDPNDDVGTRTIFEVIPAVRGWETVDRWYDQALTLMENKWQENKRRWGGDSE
jgi:hypothetical protein